MLHNFYETIVHLDTFTKHSRELIQKEVDFDCIGTCSEAFGKWKLCVNSDISAWVILTNPICHEYATHMGYLNNTFTKILLHKNGQRWP